MGPVENGGDDGIPEPRCHSLDFTYGIDHPRGSIKCNKDLRSSDGLTPKELMGSTGWIRRGFEFHRLVPLNSVKRAVSYVMTRRKFLGATIAGSATVLAGTSFVFKTCFSGDEFSYPDNISIGRGSFR